MNHCGFILAIDSYLVRKGLAAVLNRIPGILVLKEFDAASRLIHHMKHHTADYLVISQSLFDQATDLFISHAGLLEKTILLTDNPGVHSRGDPSPGKLSASEVQASIHPRESKEEIMAKISAILDSRSGEVSGLSSSRLSPRETTIVRLISMGLTNKQIAGELFLSAHTVITHRKNICAKLGIKSVSGLTVYAIVNNIITIGEVTSKPDQ